MKRLVLRASLVLALLPVAAFAQVPEPDAGSLGASFLAAVTTKNWALLVSVLLVGGVLLARLVAKRFGGKVGLWLASPRGSAVLATLGGTATLLMYALRNGTPFSVDLLLGCLGTALTASGLWSVGKAVVEPTKKPDVTQSAMPVCSAADIANGKPGCV
jgi:hypothetical protein